MSSLLLSVALKLYERQVQVQCQGLAQRLLSAPNTSQLPPEIWLEVFSYTRDDNPTLRNFSLVCLFFRIMSIPHLFRSMVFPFPSSLRRAFRLLHSTYIHPYVGSINLTTTPKVDNMKPGLSLRVIIPALLNMVHLQRLAIDFACPTELYKYIRDSKQIKHLLWTEPASKINSSKRPQCRLETIELSEVGKKGLIPAGLIMESASTLKSLSVHSREYIHAVWGFTQASPFSNLTSFTFSSTDRDIAPHTLRDTLELCPSLTALHLPTPLQHAFLLSPGALPKLNTLNVGANEFVLRFLEGRPVRRLFAKFTLFSSASWRQYIPTCSFSLLHVEIEYGYARAFLSDFNRALIYCEDLALDVLVAGERPFSDFIASIPHLTPIQLSDDVAALLITWLTAPSLVGLSLTIRGGRYRWPACSQVEMPRQLERWLHITCGGSPNLQQLKVKCILSPTIELRFHARRLRDDEWVLRTSSWSSEASWYGTEASRYNAVTSWYRTGTELTRTEVHRVLGRRFAMLNP